MKSMIKKIIKKNLEKSSFSFSLEEETIKGIKLEFLKDEDYKGDHHIYSVYLRKSPSVSYKDFEKEIDLVLETCDLNTEVPLYWYIDYDVKSNELKRPMLEKLTKTIRKTELLMIPSTNHLSNEKEITKHLFLELVVSGYVLYFLEDPSWLIKSLGIKEALDSDDDLNHLETKVN